MLAIWEPVAVSEPATRGLIEHYRQVLTRLKGATAEQYALHAARTGLRADEAARANTERLKEALVHLPDEEFEALLENLPGQSQERHYRAPARCQIAPARRVASERGLPTRGVQPPPGGNRHRGMHRWMAHHGGP